MTCVPSIVVGLFLPVWKKIDISNGFRYMLYCWKLVEYDNQNVLINLVYFPYCLLSLFGMFNIFLLIRMLVFGNNLLVQRQTGLLFLLSEATFVVFIFITARKFSMEWMAYIRGSFSPAIILFVAPIMLVVLHVVFTLTKIRRIKNTHKLYSTLQ